MGCLEKGEVSQFPLDQSIITKRQHTDKKVKRTENIAAIALEWSFVSATLFPTIYCQFLCSDYCCVLFLFVSKCTVCYVLVFVSAFINITSHKLYLYSNFRVAN